MIHMTTTGSRDFGATWDVICRCEWQSTGHASQHAARVAGDAHLAEANAPAGGEPQ